MKTIKPSWILSSSLDTHDNLFLLNDIETNYIVDVYVCKCGKNEFIVRDEYKQKYICQRCHNSLFFNVEDLTSNTNDFIIDRYYKDKIKLDFTCEFDIKPFNGKLKATAITQVPANIDYSIKKIFYKDVVINSLDFQADYIPYQGSLPSSKKLLELANDHYRFENIIDQSLLSKNANKKRKEIRFFINNFHFKDTEFMKWKSLDIFKNKDYTVDKALVTLSNDKQYKSVKKTIFLNYEFQFKKYKQFNPVMIDIATSRFTDPNHIVSILQLDFEPQYFDSKFDEELNMCKYTYEFIDFLLERYTQKQVCDYLKKLEDTIRFKFDIYYDTLVEFNYSNSILKKDFKKVKCTPNALHDELVRVSSIKRYSYMFDKKLTYTKKQLEPVASISDYIVKVPQNGAELYMWADMLHNCMASYFNNIQDNKTTIYVFFKDNQIKFAVEIDNQNIVQARGRFNSDLNSEENTILYKWVNEHFTIQDEISKDIPENTKVSLSTIEAYIEEFKNRKTSSKNII